MNAVFAYCGIALLFSACSQKASAEALEQRRVGARACASCHEREFRAWSAGPHRKAALSTSQSTGNCKTCHGPPNQGVSCEDCHGPGRHYSENDIMRNRGLASSLGLRMLANAKERAPICTGCHLGQSLLYGFDTEAAWARIAH